MRRLGDVESEAECTEAKRRRGSKSAGADRSLCPNAQTKTHVSMSLQSHFAAHGHCTARQSRSVFAAAKGVPMTRPVTPVHPTGQAPCQPIAKRHAAMEPLACKDQMRTQAPCKNGMRPLRPCLRVQVFNAGRRLHAARVPAAVTWERGIQRTQQSLSNGQRPGKQHPPACTSTANRRGCGGRACP